MTKRVRFIPCSENSQTFNWQLTNKKATYTNKNVSDEPEIEKIRKKPRNKSKKHGNRGNK